VNMALSLQLGPHMSLFRKALMTVVRARLKVVEGVPPAGAEK
jgi:hypothetical protein